VETVAPDPASPLPPRWDRLLPRSLKVLRHRDFALVQAGNAISQIGTWMQFVALGWGIRQLSAWPFAISLAIVAQFGPSLFLSSYAGWIADRYDRRKVVMVGNWAMFFPPLAIGITISLGVQSIASYVALATLGGIAQAMTQPAMVAVVPRIVPEREVAQAIAGQSVFQHLARVIGPMIGAVVINTWSLSAGFYLNAVSFLAVVLAWSFVHLPAEPRREHHDESFWSRIRGGIAYSRRHPLVLHLLVYAAVMSLFVFHAALLPGVATDVLHAGAGGYGLLNSAAGFGAICGALLAGEITSDTRRRVALVAGVLASASGYALVAVSHVLALSVAGMGIFGLGFFLAGATSQSILLSATDDVYRGRVMGLYATMVMGFSPIAALASGALASVLGVTDTFLVAAIVMYVYCAWFVLSGASRSVAIDDLLDARLDPDDAALRDKG
jgi:MFS family permease